LTRVFKSHRQIAAQEALKQLAGNPAKARSSGPAPTPACLAKLDRMQGYSHSNPTAALRRVPGFKAGRGHRIKPPAGERFQPYGYVQWFENQTSAMKFLVESKRREAWLPPYRLTLYGDDRSGLSPGEAFSVLEVLHDFHMTMLELAFDFAPNHIDRNFVRNHALFGKSQPVPSIGTSDYWGSRRGTKRAQSYFKQI
jgi:hypothetical protein